MIFLILMSIGVIGSSVSFLTLIAIIGKYSSAKWLNDSKRGDL